MPVLNATDIESLMSNFPITRLSYEVYVHKNDDPNLTQNNIPTDSKCFIIPKGRRCIAWATEWKRHKIFAIIEILTQKNKIPGVFRKFHETNGWYPGKVQTHDTCFHPSLTYGTVLGGVLFRPDNTMIHCFSIVHIYWYKGTPIHNLTLSKHITLCERMFTTDQSFRQVAYTNSNSIIVGLPVLCTLGEGSGSGSGSGSGGGGGGWGVGVGVGALAGGRIGSRRDISTIVSLYSIFHFIQK